MRGIWAAANPASGPRRSWLALTALTAVLALGVAGCADIDDALFGGGEAAPAQTGPAGTLPQQASTAPASSPESGGGTIETAGTLPGTVGGSASVSGTGTMAPITPVTVEPGSDTGTAVNKKVQELRTELGNIENKIVSNAQQLASLRDAAAQDATAYHEAKAHITTRLQMGTTKGNPELVGEWNQAQSALDQLTGNINSLNAVGTDVANDASRTHYVLDTIQAAFNVSGAVDEDHRQLSVLQDETNQTIVVIDTLLTEISEDVQRQTAYVANERANLTTLASAIKNGELYGGELGGVMLGANGAASNYASAGGGTPLVTIRFDRPGVEYQQILYTALAQALQARPGAGFDVVAVSPTRGTAAAVQLAQTAAERHAQEVFRSMTDMGVPATRLQVSSATDPNATSSEVRVYVR